MDAQAMDVDRSAAAPRSQAQHGRMLGENFRAVALTQDYIPRTRVQDHSAHRAGARIIFSPLPFDPSNTNNPQAKMGTARKHLRGRAVHPRFLLAAGSEERSHL